MRTTKQILPLALIIVLLSAAVFLVRPGGPLDDVLRPAPPTEPPVSEELPDFPALPAPTPPDTDLPLDPDSPVDPTPPVIEPTYEYACDISAYLPAIETTYHTGAMLLVNKTHPLSSGFVPSALVNLSGEDSSGGKSLQLDATAAAALRAMLLCMRADGITDAYITSAYRSYAYQNTLHNSYIKKEQQGISADAYACLGYDYIKKWYLDHGKTQLSAEDARTVVLSYSAAPGTSEHQSGLCVDFITASMTGLTNDQFEATRAFAWLRENACQFGFILRFPEGKTNVTGYTYESWHYRFVGKEAAIAITKADITLEEYLAK